jgi:hypothetical protein
MLDILKMELRRVARPKSVAYNKQNGQVKSGQTIAQKDLSIG